MAGSHQDLRDLHAKGKIIIDRIAETIDHKGSCSRSESKHHAKTLDAFAAMVKLGEAANGKRSMPSMDEAIQPLKEFRTSAGKSNKFENINIKTYELDELSDFITELQIHLTVKALGEKNNLALQQKKTEIDNIRAELNSALHIHQDYQAQKENEIRLLKQMIDNYTNLISFAEKSTGKVELNIDTGSNKAESSHSSIQSSTLMHSPKLFQPSSPIKTEQKERIVSHALTQ